MNSLQTKLFDTQITYTGEQLKSHWIYAQSKILGNALVAFAGPCDVTLEHMVDLIDVAEKRPIASQQMLHFLGEFFEVPLRVGILYQHAIVGMAYDELLRAKVADVSRSGNDLFVAGKKLSVSIATVSPTSVLLHVGINIENEGTPIPTSALTPLGIRWRDFATTVLEIFRSHYQDWEKSLVKVRGSSS